MVKANQIGIMGGSFDPPHTGHLLMAQDAMEAFELDRVLFVPCAVPPHKPDRLAAAEHRLAMLDRAVQECPGFDVSRIEIDRGGRSYTLDTLEALSARHPDCRFSFIIGADSLHELHSWYKIDHMLAQYRFLVMGRPGWTPERWDAESLKLTSGQIEDLKQHYCRAHHIDISSTDIRNRVAEGMRIKFLVPAEVEMYIVEHRLYAGGSN